MSAQSYRIDALEKKFGRGQNAVTAIERLDLVIEPGELVVLLGPSGCGKTTALRCVAGLESGTAGRISFGDRVVFDADKRVDLAPDRRGIGMVFQSYALWPHKTVRQNIAYPLKVRGLTEGLKEGWVDAAAEMVDCGHLLDRYPGQLSGGQQQRVALARGIVARPDLVLFDEPLSNLDALLRNQVRKDLHELHRRLGFTGIYVTHDQSEALAIGDRLAVMRAGRMEQIGTPDEIYSRPATEYAANFVGLTNVLVFERDATGWRTSGGTFDEPLDIDVPEADGEVHLRFRPGAAHVGAGDGEPSLNLRATVVDSVYAGGRYEMTLEAGGTRFGAIADLAVARGLAVGEVVPVALRWADSSWYTADGARVEPRAARQPSVV